MSREIGPSITEWPKPVTIADHIAVGSLRAYAAVIALGSVLGAAIGGLLR